MQSSLLASVALYFSFGSARENQCVCDRIPSATLGLSSAACKVNTTTFSLSKHHLVVASKNATSCLGFDGELAVATLPCNKNDTGLQWLTGTFGDNTLLNTITQKCLTASPSGNMVLAPCANPPINQSWEFTEDGDMQLAGNMSSPKCATQVSVNKNSPCWVNRTLTFWNNEPVPSYAHLGLLRDSFGGDITISVELNSTWNGVSEEWARVVDLGNVYDVRTGKVGHNIILAHNGKGRWLSYQVYGTTAQPRTPQVKSKWKIPVDQWLHVVVVQQGATATMFWKFNGGDFTEQGKGSVNIPAFVVRQHNLVGRSNWATDPSVPCHVHTQRHTHAYVRIHMHVRRHRCRRRHRHI